jgi:hypothetical protein
MGYTAGKDLTVRPFDEAAFKAARERRRQDREAEIARTKTAAGG